MKKITLCFLMLLVTVKIAASQEIKRLEEFENTNHPQIGYWFLTAESLENDRYLSDLDAMIDDSMLDFFFLDARHGASFKNYKLMNKVLKNIVEKGHERGVKIGLRVRVPNDEEIPQEYQEVYMEEDATQLSADGKGTLRFTTDYIQFPDGWSNNIYKGVVGKEVYRVFAFKETGRDFYDPSTLKELSEKEYTVKDLANGLSLEINAGATLADYTVFGMAHFQFNAVSNFSPHAEEKLKEFIDAYSNIPLDGIMLDEYGNEWRKAPWDLNEELNTDRLRFYSPFLRKTLKEQLGESEEMIALNMRYAPEGKPEVRIRAMNAYIDEVRKGPLKIEQAMYDQSKSTFGKDCFIGAHSTFHNDPIGDEFWTTGMNWWTIPRDYGHSDIYVPIQDKLGIALSYPAKAMYNMDFDPSILKFQEKAFTDLRYGIRTHYHAFNDAHTGWGVTLEDPVAYAYLNPVEKAARLLNRFNPALPKIDVLVIFGMEGFGNWYPNYSNRGDYDLNDAMRVREKSKMIMDAGYTTAVVSSDLINNGSLKINENGGAEMHGQVFESIVYINPQYAKKPVQEFLKSYVENGGKLMMEGKATHDFKGNDITGWFKQVQEKVTIPHFSVEQLISLNAYKNPIEHGVRNRDGSMVFTHLESFRNGEEVAFKGATIRKDGADNYEVICKGFAALDVTKVNGLEKLAATGFRELKKNGKVILSLEENADVFVKRTEKGYSIQFEDKRGKNEVLVNQLKKK